MENLAVCGQPIDLSLLDNAALTLYSQNCQNFEYINNLLISFSSRQDLILYTGHVLLSSCSPCSKFLFMLGLEKVISTNWLTLPNSVKLDNRRVILEFINRSVDPSLQVVLTKCFSVLSEILKFDLNKEWDTFFDEFYLIASANPLNFIKFLAFFLSVIVTDSEEAMTSNRASEIMIAITGEFEGIIPFINFIFQDNPDSLDIIKSIYPLMSALLNWLSPNFISETLFFQQVWEVYIYDPNLMMDSCEFFIEFICSIKSCSENICLVNRLFTLIVNQLNGICGTDGFCSLPHKICCSFIQALEHCLNMFSMIFYEKESFPLLQIAFSWLIQMTNAANDDSGLELCFNTWVSSYYQILLGQSCTENHTLFLSLTPQIRRAIILKIPIPYYFSNFIDEFGIESHQFQCKITTDSTFLTIRECFVFLANLDSEDTIKAFEERMFSISELGVDDIQRLCYVIAATSGIYNEHIENNAILPMIQKLFSLSQTRIIEERPKIACGLIYMCSLYYTLMNRFFPLYKAVFQLISKFLLEKNEELQAVSIYGLKNLARFCKQNFIFKNPDESQSFFYELLANSEQIIRSLSADNIIEIFKVFGFCVRSFPDESSRSEALKLLMNGVTPLWDHATEPQFDPLNLESCRVLTIYLQCHWSILMSLSITYYPLLCEFRPRFIMLFNTISNSLQFASDEDKINMMKSVKSNIIYIFYRFCYFCHNQSAIIELNIPDMLNLIVDDYCNSQPQLMLSASLKYLVAVYDRCAGVIENIVFDSFDKIMFSTLNIIKNSFNVYENLRYDFFSLMGTIIHSFSHLISNKPPEYIDNFLETLKFGAEHQQPQISEMCIELITDFFNTQKVTMTNPNQFSLFFDQHCLPTIQFFFTLLTDLSHKFAFDQEAISIKTFFLIENIRPKAPEIMELLCQMFQTLNPIFVARTVQSLIDEQYYETRCTLRDFILQVKIVIPNDRDLYRKEKEEMRKQLMEPILSSNHQQEEVDEVPSELVDDIASMSIHH